MAMTDPERAERKRLRGLKANAKWRAKNRERERLRNKAYRKANRDKVLAQHKRYREQHHDEIAAKGLAWREGRREITRAKANAQRAANLELMRQLDRAYRVAHPDRVKATVRKYRQSERGVQTQKAIQVENELRETEAAAKKRVAEALGEANSAIEKAKGQSEANRLLTASITRDLLEWRRYTILERQTERWNGQLPVTMLGSEGVPLINLQPAPRQ